jgi:hypothetical protein
MRMEPVKFFVAGCACVFGACMAIEYAQAQPFIFPVPPPPPPIFNPSTPNTVPQTGQTHVSPNARQAPFRGNLRPIGQDLRLTIVSTDENDPASNPGGDIDKDGGDAVKAAHEKPLDSIREMNAALHTCWMPPPKDSARHGMEYTIRFAFKRDGEIIAPPRVTYSSHDAPADVRDLYRDAIRQPVPKRADPSHAPAVTVLAQSNLWTARSRRVACGSITASRNGLRHFGQVSSIKRSNDRVGLL